MKEKHQTVEIKESYELCGVSKQERMTKEDKTRRREMEVSGIRGQTVRLRDNVLCQSNQDGDSNRTLQGYTARVEEPHRE